jgi:hypothetical protein
MWESVNDLCLIVRILYLFDAMQIILFIDSCGDENSNR